MEYIYGYQKTRAGLSRWLEDVGKRQPDDQLARSSSSNSPGITTITEYSTPRYTARLRAIYKKNFPQPGTSFPLSSPPTKVPGRWNPDSWRMTNEYFGGQGPLAGELPILSHP